VEKTPLCGAALSPHFLSIFLSSSLRMKTFAFGTLILGLNAGVQCMFTHRPTATSSPVQMGKKPRLTDGSSLMNDESIAGSSYRSSDSHLSYYPRGASPDQASPPQGPSFMNPTTMAREAPIQEEPMPNFDDIQASFDQDTEPKRPFKANDHERLSLKKAPYGRPMPARLMALIGRDAQRHRRCTALYNDEFLDEQMTVAFLRLSARNFVQDLVTNQPEIDGVSLQTVHQEELPRFPNPFYWSMYRALIYMQSHCEPYAHRQSGDLLLPDSNIKETTDLRSPTARESLLTMQFTMTRCMSELFQVRKWNLWLVEPAYFALRSKEVHACVLQKVAGIKQEP
jgi:hypothetical protein